MKAITKEYDFIIIGSGFGGSISAMRLSQKGYKVAIIEKGKRWTAGTFPNSNWNVKKYFWMPLLRFFGPQALSFIGDLLVIHGVGVGGGSLVYANTLLRPKKEVFSIGRWPKNINWAEELQPHYDMAEKMLGATKNNYLGKSEKLLKELAEDMNAADSFHETNVGVYFGADGDKRPRDPYFSGKGPKRAPCNYCGGCMVGCRFNAKNTLDKNYLYFAEQWGAEVIAESEVEKIIPVSSRGYIVETKSSTQLMFKERNQFFAKNVIVAAGALGTTKILLENRDVHRTLPELSGTLGHHVRSNGESLLGVTSYKVVEDFSDGIAIGAGFNTSDNTKIETVRYPKGSGVMSLLAVPLTGPGNIITRPLKLFKNIIYRFPQFLRTRFNGDWASKTIVLLVMQSIEEKMTLVLKRKPWTLFRLGLAGNSGAHKPPSYLPIAQEAAMRLSEKIDGAPQNSINEVLLATSATAHILGGAPMGDSADNSVVDSNHEVHGYKGLYISDGSTVPGNLGVNPSLTISAMTERFCAQFPVNPECDPKILEERKITFSDGWIQSQDRHSERSGKSN